MTILPRCRDGRPPLFELYPGLKMRLPHIVFSDRLTVNLPGATVHLKHYDQSHSRGDATAYFAEGRRILCRRSALYRVLSRNRLRPNQELDRDAWRIERGKLRQDHARS
jgi:hypothetical protein